MQLSCCTASAAQCRIVISPGRAIGAVGSSRVSVRLKIRSGMLQRRAAVGVCPGWEEGWVHVGFLHGNEVQVQAKRVERESALRDISDQELPKAFRMCCPMIGMRSRRTRQLTCSAWIRR